MKKISKLQKGPLILLLSLVLAGCVGPRTDVIVKPPSEVDELPEIVGGLEYFVKEMKYPAEAKEKELEGRVLVQFVVDVNGEVQDASVIEGIGAGCDDEALRVVESANFTPGKIDGEAVPVQMMIPIQFKLQKD